MHFRPISHTTLLHALSAILLLSTTISALADQSNDNGFPPSKVILEDGVESVMIQADAAGRYFANGEINGQPVRFHIDTGATNISIPSSVADRLNLPIYGEGVSHTAAGEVKIQGAYLKSVGLSGIVITNLEGRVNPSTEGFDILLGNEFLKHLDIKIKGSSLILNARNTVSARANPHPQFHSGLNKLVLEADAQGHYFVSGRVNGSIVKFMIDTGADHTVLPAHIARRLQLPKLDEIDMHTAGGTATGYITGPLDIRIGRLRINKIYGIISPKMPSNFGLIGMDFLKNYEFEQQGNKLILTIPK